jgi:hypothetical protein
MKKILFLVTQSEFGGAQRYIFEILTHLNPQKYEVLVGAGEGDGELFEKFKVQIFKESSLALAGFSFYFRNF